MFVWVGEEVIDMDVEAVQSARTGFECTAINSVNSEIAVNMHQVGAAPASIVRRAAHSVLALGVRQVLTAGMGFLGGILLARLLSPAEFGLYAIITFLLPFLLTFGDVGLAAGLVRQAHEPVGEGHQPVFTVQHGLVGSVIIL